MKKYGTLPGPLALICMGAALLAWQIHDWNPTDVYGMRLARSAIAMLFIAGAIIWRRLSTAKVPPGGSLVVRGSLKMDDLDELHDIQLPLGTCYNTVGGFLLERLGHAPRIGEFVDLMGYRFAVAQIDQQTISRVRIQELTGHAHLDRTAELIVRSEDAGPDTKPSRN